MTSIVRKFSIKNCQLISRSNISNVNGLGYIAVRDTLRKELLLPTRFEPQQQMNEFKRELTDIDELYCACEDEGDEKFKIELNEQILDIQSRFSDFRLQCVLDAPGNKGSDCFVDIVAGAGGADAFDWVQMLVEMYSQWAGGNSKSEMGFVSSLVCATKNTEADSGYRHATLRITGQDCLGWMRAESGVHRLVRISPFDPSHKRHTSFAQVIVYPNIESSQSSIKGNKGSSNTINESDLRIDTYRSSGAGGQSVNKTDSAVRLTHIPSGIVVTCQNQRSQHQNKAFAMNILRSRIAAVEMEKSLQRKQDSMTGNGDGSWGNQIKSLVLNPYRIVKDHRTKWESGNVDSYLAGGKILTESIREFLESQYYQT